MIGKLGFDDLRQSHISAFELGAREPSSIVLLQYARVAGVTMEELVDDELDLSGPSRRQTQPDASRRKTKAGGK